MSAFSRSMPQLDQIFQVDQEERALIGGALWLVALWLVATGK